ncbi:unnamed protein product [Sphacelaria rigidula]
MNGTWGARARTALLYTRRPWILSISYSLLVVLMVAAVSSVASNKGLRASSQLPKGGTVMFLHVWKCGGTSLRKLVCNWAKSEGLPCATVAACSHLSLHVSIQ